MAGYRIQQPHQLHFVTLSVVDWIDLFTRKTHRDLLLDSLAYCRQYKGLHVHAYVIMTNHLHLIVHAEAPFHLSAVLRDFKKYTAVKLLEAIRSEPESRREWLLELFAKNARRHARRLTPCALHPYIRPGRHCKKSHFWI